MTRVLYNPYAACGKGLESAKRVEKLLSGEPEYVDITTVDAVEYINALPEEDSVVIGGGDGTLNVFINRLHGELPRRKISYFPCGMGNDFAADVSILEGSLIPLNDYIECLPAVEVEGTRRRFLNGVGFGIDGYCCEEGDRLRAAGQTDIKYSSIAIKGLMGKFEPRGARVIVDGTERRYENVWLAPTMNGRFYGGGMMIAPEQNREEPTLSLVVFHCKSKLRTLMVFPSIFKGEHVKKEKMVDILTGREIKVEFDRPTPLQIDGETVSGVTGYTAVSGAQTGAREHEKSADSGR